VVTSNRAGFTLVEAIVALALSSVLVVLVGTTFLVQNRYYAVQVERSAVQDNARMVTELVASEIRSTMKNGVVTASNKKLVVRSPIAVAVLCGDLAGPKFSLFIRGAGSVIDLTEVTGIAKRDTLTGDWSYKDQTWAKLENPSNAAAGTCAAQGADTVGLYDDFHDVVKLNSLFGSYPPLGTVYMLFREVEYTFGTSVLDPTTFALFRKVKGGVAVELATGMDSSAQFQYRRSDKTTYATSVGGGDVGKIIAIRIEAEARRAPQTGGVDDVTFGWGVNVMLRNGP